MTHLEQLLAIARNTFFESIRQPVLFVALVAATILIILSNPLAAYTLEDDQRMFVDIGLSTIFIATAVVAAFISTNVLSREIDNKTVLTVVSKPVARPTFVLGKYLGTAGATLLATAYLANVFMLVEMHGVLQTARTPMHQPVLVFGTLAGLLGIGAATWANYFYGRNFVATAAVLLTPLSLLAYVIAMLFDAGWKPLSAAEIFSGIGIGGSPDPVFEGQIWIAIGTMSMATLILVAVALAASTRLGQVLTLSVTLGVFLLGLLSDWLFARPLRTLDAAIAAAGPDAPGLLLERAEALGFRTLYSITPNFQVFWLADAINQDRAIPPSYLALVIPYGIGTIVAILAVATALFQRREVG
jgi:ABC-type transport system involved in multi-copper enzyme maturation permease subunit